jgi:AcrR family transcriptional regulator
VRRERLDATRVVAEAVRIADADGLGAVTLARVAAALGVRAPSLYNHVDGREALLRAVALRGLHDLGDALRRAAVGRARGEALAGAADAYRAYAKAHPGCFAAAVAGRAIRDPDLQAAGVDVVAVLTAIVGGWGLEDEPAIHAVRAIRSALHGFVAIEADGGFDLDVDVDMSFARLVQTLAAGLEAVPAGA